MQKLFLIPLLVSTILFLHTVSSLCPADCFCLAGYVTCSDLKSIPTAFPADTRSLSISNIDVDEIPAGVFDKLLEVESIEIYHGKIGKIARAAFSSLIDMDLISLSELHIGTIESYAFSNITEIGTISIYMSEIETIQRFAFSNLFALDEIKLFMLDIQNVESFAMTNIEELYQFYFYTNNIETMQPYAFSNFVDVPKLSLFLNNFGHLGCGSIETLVSETYEQSFYSNSVNCSCDILWIVSDVRLYKYMFSNWCKVPNMNKKIYWEDISSDTLHCDLKAIYVCPPATTFELSETASTKPSKLTSQTVTKQVSSTYDQSNTDFTSKPTVIETTVLQTENPGIRTNALNSRIFSEPTSSVYDPSSSVSSSTSYVSEPTRYVSVSTPSVSESTTSANEPKSSVPESASPTPDPTSYVTESTSSVTGAKLSVSGLVSSTLKTTSSVLESTPSVSDSSSSVVQPSRLPQPVTMTLGTSMETSVPAGPMSEKTTTRQTETKFWSSEILNSTQKEKARVTDLLLLSTKKMQYVTKPSVVISEETDVIKAVSSSPKRPQPQNVSHNDAARHVGGSRKLGSVVSLLFLTFVVKMI